jgi:hypothetical protein
MMYRVVRGRWFGRLAAVLMIPAAVSSTPVAAEEAVAAPPVPKMEAAPWPSRVEATYKVNFNGFDIGDFRFQASVNGSSYSLSGNAELSALLGAFTWSGATRSAGQVSGETPRPQGYTFDFRANSKGGSIKMNFNEGTVAQVTSVPPSMPIPGSVPVREQHLKDVLDPLTAVMALARGKSSNPCGRKIAVFDGKQRFDLLLSFRRQQRIAEQQPSGQPSMVYVCRVRYIPIAGHRNSDETREMAANAGIEVALRPIPSANLLVPYQITIPTGAGTATLTSQRVDIVTGRRQIALVH